MERLSEPGGYFDTDNLVSNEDSYLHPITGLARHGVRGGASSRHPQAVPGYLSVQLLQSLDAFLAVQRASGFRSYRDLVTGETLPAR